MKRARFGRSPLVLVHALVLPVLVVAAGVISRPLHASDAPASGKKPDAKSSSAHHEHVTLTPADLKWGAAPPTLPAGAKLAVLEGDPAKPGPFTIRIQAPDGYKVMPHWHPTAEHLTIISGTFHIATGDTFDQAKGTTLQAGSYASMPAHMHHYAWSSGETIVQVHGTGPFKIIYINPADDPSGMQGKAAAATTKSSSPK